MTTATAASGTPKGSGHRCVVERTPGRRRLIGPLLAVLLITALLAGCAKGISPGQAAPSLASTLDRVDADVAAGHLPAARSDLQTLITETKQAQQRGDISASQAVRILDAARSVLAQLPAAAPGPSASPTPSATPSPPSKSTTQAQPEGGKSGPGPAGEQHHKPGKKHKRGDAGNQQGSHGNRNNGNHNGEN